MLHIHDPSNMRMLTVCLPGDMLMALACADHGWLE